jgi:hypothetical protein
MFRYPEEAFWVMMSAVFLSQRGILQEVQGILDTKARCTVRKGQQVRSLRYTAKTVFSLTQCGELLFIGKEK